MRAQTAERRAEVLALLRSARLMVILGEGEGERHPVRAGEAALAGGARLLQLRCKRWSARGLFEAARALAPACRQAGAALIVDDRPDVALAAGADGAHLGQQDLPVAAARAAFGERLVLGATVHGPEEVAQAALADYVGLGTVFPSRTRPELPARGLELIRELVPRLRPLPVFAVGGIDAARARACLQAGADGVAVGAAITAAPDIEAATRQLLAALGATTSP